MATKTNFLNLVLPANNEYNNTWDTVLNKNLTLIDAAVEEVTNEVQEARGTGTNLAAFLGVGHYSDGNLKPSPEILAARNSFLYGDDDGAGNNYLLKNRLQLSDQELYSAREGLPSLLTSLARHSSDFDYPDTVFKGPATSLGQPNFLTGSGSEFQLNGDPTIIELNIAGYYLRVRTDESVLVSGADGTRYLYAQKPTTAETVLNRSTQQAASTTTNPLNSNKVQILQDSGIDFTGQDVKVGDILEILNTDNAGKYIIAEIAPSANTNQIKVIGSFALVITNVNYKIYDPLKPTFGVDTAYLPTAGKCYIGQGEYTAGALTSTLSYAFKTKYESDYQAVNVTTLPTFEKIFSHNLGIMPKKVLIYASQSNDDSTSVEPLSVAVAGHDLSVSISNTLTHTPGVFSPGTSDASFAGGSLTGDVTGSLSGNVYALRSVLIKITKTQIFVKNIKSNHFYRDYDGTDQQVGYIKVVCEK
jgi:hypothetical protein